MCCLSGARKREGQTDRQTDRDRYTERDTERDRQRQTQRERYTHRDKRERDRQTEREREKREGRHRERETDRQKGRQTEGEQKKYRLSMSVTFLSIKSQLHRLSDTQDAGRGKVVQQPVSCRRGEKHPLVHNHRKGMKPSPTPKEDSGHEAHTAGSQVWIQGKSGHRVSLGTG